MAIKTSADGAADHEPAERRDQIVLEGVFDHENDAQKKREPAEPGEQLHAHERLPIERRAAGMVASRWQRLARSRRDELPLVQDSPRRVIPWGHKQR